MNDTACDISVIIPSFNTAMLLKDCLESIVTKPRQSSAELIVVDNGSSDGTPALVAGQFPQVVLIALSRNVGYGAACNIGAGRALGRFLLFLNSDTQALEGTLDTIVEIFRAEPSVTAVACRELEESGATVMGCRSHHTLRSAISFLTGYRLFRREGNRYRIADWDRCSDREVDNVTGFAWAIRRETFQALGGFDEKLFLYCEEEDMSLRLQRAGATLRYVAAARILHLGAGSSAGLGSFGRRRRWLESFVYLREKHGQSRSRAVDRLALYPFLLLWAVGRSVLGRRRRALK